MAANDVPCCEPMFWVYLVICIALVSFAGLMSGLTLGLMSLSLVELEVLVKAGEPQERKKAEKILPLVKNRHLLLCTLLIGNALAMEALPIFIDALLPAWGAILISVTLILAFGEIIPQAVCSRYGLSVGAKLSFPVRLIVIVLFPLAYPISKLLDLLLGKRHSALLRRAELKTLVDMHGNEAGKGGELTHDETTIITGALDMAQKTAKNAMTPVSETFSLDINSRLDEETVGLIVSKGHSRVPVYSGNPANIIGFILIKNLIKFRPEDETPIRDLTIRRMPRVHENLPLYDILNIFQMGYSHIAVVFGSKKDNDDKMDREKVTGFAYKSGQNEQVAISMPSMISSHADHQSPARENVKDDEFLSVGYEEVIGIITLEDVVEELIQEEILDETDEYVDVHRRIRINMFSPRISPSSASDLDRRSQLASPISPYHQSPFSSSDITPVLGPPITSPYIQSPIVKRSPNASPTKQPSPAAARFSPSPRRISRKTYEKLMKPDGS